MKKNSKNKGVQKHLMIFIYILLLSSLMLNFVSAAKSSSLISATCSIEPEDVVLLNQDPYPAVPGEYVKVVFQITGLNDRSCDGAKFELVPDYPFSLDGNNSFRSIDGDTYVANYNTAWLIPYKMRIDEKAIDGENEIIVKYGERSSTYLMTKKFNITIEDSRTTFDAVIQESTNSEVSIAIANTGKYIANSVVVRIPEQEGFRMTGTDGQMIGNLDSGDYTIVSFSLTPIIQRNTQIDSNENTRPNFQSKENNLKFDTYYTDTLGERRIVNMELPLQMTSFITTDGEIPEDILNRNMRNNNSSWFSWSNWYILIIILVLVGVIFFLYKKYPKKTKKFYNKSKQEIKEFFDKKDVSDNSNIIPDWIKNAKEKKK